MASCVRDKASIHNVCQLCGSLENLLLCGGCKTIWYCCKEHQKFDWKNHKVACRSRKRSKGHDVDPSVQSTTFSEDLELKGSSQVTGVKYGNQNAASNDIRDHKRVDDMNHRVPLREENENVNKNNLSSGSRTRASHLTKTNHCTDESSINKLADDLSEVPFCKTDSYNNTETEYFAHGSAEYEILSSDGSALCGVNNGSENAEKNEMSPPSVVEPGSFGSKKEENVDARQTYMSIMESRNNQLADYVVKCLNTYGICVIDNFLGDMKGKEILEDVKKIHCSGSFKEGQLVDSSMASNRSIRSDILTWVDGSEKNASNIKFLISSMDTVVLKCDGKLGHYKIKERTKAMVACYPGHGSHYMRHVDNPNGDGRCVTCIYYLNQEWDPKLDGGILRIFPQGENKVASIEPKFDRLLFFWSDRRNPHEVLPAQRTRYAITVWYYDAEERHHAVKRFKGERGLKPKAVPLINLHK